MDVTVSLVKHATQGRLHATEVGLVRLGPGVADDDPRGRFRAGLRVDVGEVDGIGQDADVGGELAEGIGQNSGAGGHYIGAREQIHERLAHAWGVVVRADSRCVFVDSKEVVVGLVDHHGPSRPRERVRSDAHRTCTALNDHNVGIAYRLLSLQASPSV
jgi:hypothetical protein